MKLNKTLLVLPVLVLFLLAKSADAQTQRAVVKIERHQLNQLAITLPNGVINRQAQALANVPFIPKASFMAYSIVWYSSSWDTEANYLSIMFNDGSVPLIPVEVEVDGHAEAGTYRHVSELYFLEKYATKFRLQFNGHAQIDSIAVHFFDPGLSVKSVPTIPQIPNPSLGDRSVCTCPQPPFEARLDWCPDGTCPTDPTPAFVPNPTHVIVHHTAGTNTSSDWAAVVRSIWDFHVNTNGWDDIGYNWLVDPNGVIYEGRGDGALGAHFCAQNGNTTGICVMGDFTTIQPSGSAINSLVDFLTWECCDENIDPLGTGFHSGSGLTLPFISGHRDGCSTSCPGDMFHPLLPTVRTSTQNKINNGCNSDVLAAPTVLAITFVGYNKVSLSWQDNAIGETAYLLERSVNNNSNFTQLIQLPANATAFSDNNVMPGKTYFYRVRAKQGNEFSAYSNEAIAVTGASATESRLLNGRTVQISPNPTNGFLTLNVDNQWVGNTEIAVFDAVGRIVVSPFSEGKTSQKASFQLDLSSLHAGIFLVKMVQGADVGWFRVLKN
jgi:hypothetical protein